MKKSKMITNEPVSKCFPLTAGFKIKEGKIFNHPSTICQTYPRGIGFAFHRAGGAGRNTFSISRIKN